MNHSGITAGVAVGILLLFTLAAFLFLKDPWAPIAASAGVEASDPAFADPMAVRTVSEALMSDGMRCSECHDELDPPQQDPVSAVEFHEGLVLHHGENNRCFNCHHAEQKKRDFFIHHDMTPIPYAKVEKLCAKCHGPHYQDWENGAHGRRTGFWDKRLGGQKTETCIACHNPHQPHFQPMQAAPGPQGIRREGQSRHGR